METPRTQLWLVRHAETAWSRSGRHTSTTDLDLTEEGVRQAEVLRGRLAPADFGLVLSSPRLRATRTAGSAGFPDPEIDNDLSEWRYGDYEGHTSQEIRARVPDWRIWTHPVPNGETPDEVMERLTRIVRRVQDSGVERALVFGHGHSLRVLALSWLHFDISRGQSFPLETATVSVLGFEKESPAIIGWNQRLGGDHD